MNLIILDFARRWWWVLLIVGAIAAGGTLAAEPIVLGPVGAFLLLFDGSRGALRATRALPVSSRDHALACWICGVPLVPMLCLPLMIVAALLAPVIDGSTSAPWFSLGVQTYVALGYAGLCFLIAIVLPMRPPENLSEHLLSGLAGATWGLSIPGMSFLLPNLPQSPAQIVTWHWVIFAVVPIFLVFSYVQSGELLRRRSARPLLKQRAAAPPGGVQNGKLTGIPLFLTTVPLRTAFLILFMAAVQWGFMLYMLREQAFRLDPIVLAQPALFGIMVSVMGTGWMGLRSFRILPISTWRLTALLLASPLVAALLTGILSAVALKVAVRGSHVISPLEFSALIAGVGALLLGVSLRVRGGGKIAVVFGMAALIPLTTAVLPKVPGPIMPVAAVVMFVSGVLLLHRTLRRSAAAYEATRLPFNFGQQPQ